MRSLVLVEGVKRERVNESIPCFKMWISAINSIRKQEEGQSVLVFAVSHMPLIQNNQLAKVAYLGGTHSGFLLSVRIFPRA